MDLDGLVIAGPDHVHREQTIAACKQRLPVLLEKPVASTVPEAVEMSAAAQSSGTPVLVGYVLHYFRCMQRAHDLLSDGVVGQPLSFQVVLGAYDTLAVARNRFDGDTRGALFADYSHEWDYVRWLLSPIVGGCAISRMVGDLPLRQDPNIIDAVLELADGTTGTAHLDYVQDPGSRQFSVLGDRGTLRVDAEHGVVRVQRRGSAELTIDVLADERDSAFTRQAEHFVEVIKSDAEPLVSLEDGVAALEVAHALQESAVGRRWVEVVSANSKT
jgi:hypothetical protein